MAFVVDASVSLAWCFSDETTAWTRSLLDRLIQIENASVPAHWRAETVNGLLMAVRRNRIKMLDAAAFSNRFANFPIDVEPAMNQEEALSALAFAHKHRLTIYDASYLELAARKQLPLATLDQDLRRAATAESVTLL